MLAALVAAGCADDGGQASDSATVTVYISAPELGPSRDDGRDLIDGAGLALRDADGQAGGVEVRAVSLDVTEGRGSRAGWTPAQAAANARTATRDSAAIAYLGDFESGATRASLPVTNEARMLQVSAASGAIDLVAPFPGSDDVPEAQPSGERTFGRVIAGDEAQARAAAGWAERRGARRIATVSDGSAYGDDAVASFEDALRSARVARRDAELTFYAGQPNRRPPSGSQRSSGDLMVTDAQLAPGAAESLPPGTVATSAALDPTQLPPAGRVFARHFAATYDRSPGRYAAYGYEAMAVILDSIERASDPTDRDAVIDAFFETAERDSILGAYSIDELGETTLDRMTGYEFGRGAQAQPVAELSALP